MKSLIPLLFSSLLPLHMSSPNVSVALSDDFWISGLFPADSKIKSPSRYMSACCANARDINALWVGRGAIWRLGYKHKKLEVGMIVVKSLTRANLDKPFSSECRHFASSARIAGIDHRSRSRTRRYINPGIGRDLSVAYASPSSIFERVHMIHYVDGAGWFTENHHLYVQS